jgi:hypothetical protein
MNEVTTISNERIDQLEKVMVDNFPEIECPLIHTFWDGIYIREIFMPKGSLITSKIHKTRHPFIVKEGVVSVWTNGGKEVLIKAPFEGITEPGTRRVLYIHENCRWVTLHLNPNNETVEQIENRIIVKHENLLLTKNEKLCLGLQQG